jgi:hypothetical protein
MLIYVGDILNIFKSVSSKIYHAIRYGANKCVKIFGRF